MSPFFFHACVISLCFLALYGIKTAGGEGVGVNYGLLGDNLPAPEMTVGMMKSMGVTKVRLFHPDPRVLHALAGSGMQVVLGTLNQDLPNLATSTEFAATWVRSNVAPYARLLEFRYISAGNEVIPGPLAGTVLPAIKNLEAALAGSGINVPVTTAVATSVLATSYPPSASNFSAASSPFMAPIVNHLASMNSPLLANVYPYFAYASDPDEVPLDYALFTAPGVVVQDGRYGYQNLFDAVVDSVYAAAEKSGAPGLRVVVSETGWPSAGGSTGANVENAMTYNNNAAARALRVGGTPRRPGIDMEAYVFAMYNENLKPPGIEQNFGLYYPNCSQVYHVNFTYL